MRAALVLFDGITFLDFAGFYDVFCRVDQMVEMRGSTWDICAMQESVVDERGLRVHANQVQPDLGDYELIFVPGGMGTRKRKDEEAFVAWLQTAAPVPIKLSVCTGSLLLGAAGFLQDKQATTHPQAYDLLEPYCEQVVKSRIVKDGNTVTAGGVATSIDLALYTIQWRYGTPMMEQIKAQIDYPYQMRGIVER